MVDSIVDGYNSSDAITKESILLFILAMLPESVLKEVAAYVNAVKE